MSTPAVYRFLPWTRRGLVAELRDSTNAITGNLPSRASIKLDVTLSNGLGSATSSAKIAGPGDVIGIDLSGIVRLTPRRDASNVEPNYLVAVDFDDPDFPWLLTPSAANVHGQLRPWLALIVVEDRPGVSVKPPTDGPLPVLKIESGAKRELPDLASSWAWAHTQILVAEGSGAEAAPALASDPDRHVSRLLCPRRLRPEARWLACLVPAFDAGVLRGLGKSPDATELKPAWTDQDSISLPLYFHWEFGTGPEGDFESLARRLHPFVITSENGVPTVGTVKMHIGAAGGKVRLPDGDPQRIVQMDGALRALQQEDGELSQIPTQLRDPLGELLDLIADPSGPDESAGAVGPPLYGSWAANRFHVADAPAKWFAEANLDPRARVAAGLGAEVVRREQEDLMTACWQQVGAVLNANALLSRGRLSIEASTWLHAKSINALPADRVLTYASPLSGRTPLDAMTVLAAIGPTSLPDATVDPTMRRLVAPTNRFVRKTALRREIDPTTITTKFVGTLAAGTPSVDPTDFVPAGVAPRAVPTDLGNGTFDLAPIGLPFIRQHDDVTAILEGVSAIDGSSVPAANVRLALRANIRETGMVTTRQVDAIRMIFAAQTTTTVKITSDPILALRSAALTSAGAGGFVAVIGGQLGGLQFSAFDINAQGSIVLRTPPTDASIVLAHSHGVRLSDVTAAAGRLPIGALRPGDTPAVLVSGAAANEVHTSRGGVVFDAPSGAVFTTGTIGGATTGTIGGATTTGTIGGATTTGTIGGATTGTVGGGTATTGGATTGGATIVVPPLQRDAAVLSRFEQAINFLPEFTPIQDPIPVAQVVGFALSRAADALKERCNPTNAHTARVGTMVSFGDVTLSVLLAGSAVSGLTVAPQFDRIMAYPEVNDPAYRMLARYDRDRLLPGVDSIPPDSVTLLETNPRFVAGFLAGLNHELNRELLWRRYPTDQRGTPMRRFWDRVGGATDIPPMHQWQSQTQTLVDVAGGESNLVLLIRGDLLRRYPNTVVLAIKAIDLDTPNLTDDSATLRPIFSGFLEPDITFFGFDLTDDDITDGAGYFFALQEQVTEPRFGLDEVPDEKRSSLSLWRDAAWTDTDVQPGSTFPIETVVQFGVDKGLDFPVHHAADVAGALFQNPVQVLVHGRHLAITEAN